MNFVRRFMTGCSAGLLVLLAGCAPGAPAAVPTVNVPAAIQTASGLPAVVGTAAANTMLVQLAADNNSGETGAALLTEVNGKTTVVITIVGEPAGATQPAHIHNGQCGPTLGNIVYPLTDVVNGVSTTTINVTMAQLKSAKYGLNGHKSAAEIGTTTFCGNLTQ
jgi:hypothetical protein